MSQSECDVVYDVYMVYGRPQVQQMCYNFVREIEKPAMVGKYPHIAIMYMYVYVLYCLHLLESIAYEHTNTTWDTDIHIYTPTILPTDIHLLL